MDFLLQTENFPFSVALAIMFAIAALEGIGAVIGLGFSSLLETVLPDVDFDVDGPDLDSATTLTHFMSWLRVGKVPFLIIIVVFLTSFALYGLIVQQITIGLTGALLPAWLATIPALVCGLPTVRFINGLLARLIPQDETQAVSEDSFIGKIAVITLGAASAGSPAEAKLTDDQEQSHYVMVEPDLESETFGSGTVVLVVRKAGSIFKVIENPNKSLI